MNQYDNPDFFEEYSKMPRSLYGLEGAGEWHQLKKFFPDDLKGKRVLDIGCGCGWHCAYAHNRGAAYVLGIDQSRRMISKARSINAASGIEYRLCDLQKYDYPAQEFDLVISNLVLHYVEDIAAVYKQVYRTLRQGGIFVMNIEHPTFTAGINQQFVTDGEKTLYWAVDNYYYPGERMTDFLGYPVVKQHHTLTQILMGLIEIGFSIEAVEEALPPEEWRKQMPDEMRRPMMLLVRAGKERR